MGLKAGGERLGEIGFQYMFFESLWYLAEPDFFSWSLVVVTFSNISINSSIKGCRCSFVLISSCSRKPKKAP